MFGGLERLAEQSLLRVEDDAHGDTRFTMLETIREYALERLAERGELAALQDRHADAFLAFAMAVGGGGTGAAAQARWLDRMEDEHDNLRAALDHLVETGDTGRATGVVSASWRFWHMRGHLAEARSRVDRVLAMPAWPAEPTLDRLRALEAAGGLAYWAGDLEGANGHYVDAVAGARALGDEAQLANALYNLSFARLPTGDVVEWIAMIADDDRSLLDEALAIWTRLGDEAGVARAQWALGEHFAYRGEFDAAEETTSRALATFERLDDPFWIAWSRFTRSFARILKGDVPGAAGDLAVTLREFWGSRDVSGVALVLSGLSSCLLMVGRAEDGYAVGGATRRLVAETGLHLATLWPTAEVPVADPETADPGLRAAWESGAGWSRDEAVERALAPRARSWRRPRPRAADGRTIWRCERGRGCACLSCRDDHGTARRPGVTPVTDAVRIPPIELSIETGADPETAWLAITDPDRVVLWLTAATPVGPVGSPYRLDFGDGSVVVGEVLVVEPGRRFSHTWAWEDAGPGPGTVVTWTVERVAGGRTRLALRHDGWDAAGDGEAGRDDHEAYWSGYLDDLRDVLEEA